jgi:hypothetical protein
MRYEPDVEVQARDKERNDLVFAQLRAHQDCVRCNPKEKPKNRDKVQPKKMIVCTVIKPEPVTACTCGQAKQQ